MKKVLCIISIFLTLQNYSYSQFSDQNWWYFGSMAIVDFTSGTAVGQYNPAVTITTDEAAASYSNPTTGNLVLYTNGRTVYRNNHTVISSSLNGSPNSPWIPSSAQGALIIPHITNPNQYYIFTTSDVISGASINNGLCYSIVDMSISGGTVTTLNAPAVAGTNPKTTEHLMAIPNCTNDGYWIIVHSAQLGQEDKLLVFSLTSSGLSAPVAYPSFTVTPWSAPMPSGFNGHQGLIKVSPDGRKIAISNMSENVYLYNFDKQTGIITPASTLNCPLYPGPGNGFIYGLSFSPDSKQLYIAKEIAIYQCDVTNMSTPVLNTVSVPHVYNTYRLQLGPDNKIYITQGYSLSVINNPDNINNISNAIGYSFSAVSLLTQYSGLSLPNVIDAKKPNLSAPSFVYTFNTCNEVAFNTPNCGAPVYKWNFGDGTIITTSNPTPVHTYATSGTYTVTLTIGANSTNQTVTILPSVIPITGPTSLCTGGTAPIYSTGPFTGYQYNWTATTGTFLTPSTNSSVQVNWTSTGANTIGVTVTQEGCTKTGSKIVNVNPSPVANAGPNVDECSNPVIGGSPAASGGTSPYSYSWSPAAGLSSGTIANPAASPTSTTLYTLTVTDANGCTANSNCTVTFGNDSWHQTTETTTGAEIYNDVITDRFGNVYTVGNYTKTTTLNGGGNPDITINSGLSSITNNAFVAKYDACGNLKWVANSSNCTGTTGVGVTLDEAAGMVYITGNFDQVMHFESAAGGSCSVPNPLTIYTPGSNRGYVAQFDMATGCLYFLAPLTLTTTGPLETRAITANENTHDIYVGGQYQIGATRPCAFIQKFTPATTSGTSNTLGAAVWTIQGDNTLPVTTYDRINDLDYNETTKTLYGIGDFKENSKLIPGTVSLSTTSVISNEAFICSYSEAGPLTQIIFAKGGVTAAAGNAMYGEGIAVDEATNLAFITGTYKGPVTAAFSLPGVGSLINANSEAAYMITANIGAGTAWARRAYSSSTTGKVYGKEVTCFHGRGYFMGEYSKNSIVIYGLGTPIPFYGTSSTTLPNFHVFTAAYSSTGTYVNSNVTESVNAGDIDYHTGQSIATDEDGHCFVVGKYSAKLDYYASGTPAQTALTATGGTNAFVMRTNQSTAEYKNELVEELIPASDNEEIQVYPNPTNASVTINIKNFNTNETYTLALYNSTGALVKQITVTANQTVVDLTTMENGIYLFALMHRNSTEVVRIAKTN